MESPLLPLDVVATVVRFLIAALLVGHGLVHGIMFSLPFSAQARADLPFNPSYSWLIGESRAFGLAFALVATFAFIAAGAAYFWRAVWWPAATLVAAGLCCLVGSLLHQMVDGGNLHQPRPSCGRLVDSADHITAGCSAKGRRSLLFLPKGFGGHSREPGPSAFPNPVTRRFD